MGSAVTVADGGPLVVTELREGVLIVRLNDPTQLNAISNAMREQFAAALAAASGDAVRAVVITGTGRAFSAGGDINAMVQGSRTAHSLRSRLQYSHRVLTVPMLALQKPTVAAVNGVAAGAGVSIALACDLRVVARRSSFMLAFSQLGLVPDLGIAYLLPRLIGLARAKELLLTRDRLTAEEAQEFGLVTELVDDDACVGRAVELATSLARKPPVSLGMTKRMLEMSFDHTLTTFLELETTFQAIASQTPEHIAARTAFVDKRRVATEDPIPPPAREGAPERTRTT
jgi:2-(1,2-epoxy-1,2-dihydrophenyl)acetyl-CoA isomerase